ncbi:rod shape-determining protein RodA [Thiomonas arsenitoxydans]|uniref:rod shape-determining protein RodA n=1 Tax=Thiomonas arsenitoxydans (strain DSM 22701 / CIP 110005 / 3As) TaxID=426114 RepID=UPI001ACDD6C1|nr:rod shape-determining protein RodA [Thiomonas arsenitoxydans]MBN8776120.1 rod shape-determining protein RodA [Thiomonas arsenitoxydans]
MSATFGRPPLWRRVRPYLTGFDAPLAAALLWLVAIGCIVLFSALQDAHVPFDDHLRNLGIGFLVLFVAAQVPPQRLMQIAVPVYTFGVALLIATALFGLVRKGARRWLDLGVTVVQPSEVMKIAVPLMLAWYFQKREGQIRVKDFFIATALLLLPVALIAKQPDLGTALLVLLTGAFVIFFAGLSWRVIALLFALAAASAPVMWHFMHDYQRQRLMMLLDPQSDPLGKGFNIIQSMIAIGSGGVFGQGYLHGTQAHLNFVPESHTDFVFSVLAEEWGLAGNLMLLAAYTFFIVRGLMIAANAPTLFSRLLAASVTLIFFIYAFVNMGMVSGILPVVGVPLPFVSYGGTALITLMLGAGMLFSIAKSKRLVQS